MKQQAAKGHAHKHTRAAHGKTAKHHPRGQRAHQAGQHQHQAHTVAKHPHHAKPRGAQRGTLEVLPPRSGTGAGPRQVPGASLNDWCACSAVAVATSLALTAHGPVSDSAVLALHEGAGGSVNAGVSIGEALAVAFIHGLDGVRPVHAVTLDQAADLSRPGLILGLQLAEPHAVTVAPDGCWLSWGEHYDPAEFGGAVVEEAWAVTWP